MFTGIVEEIGTVTQIQRTGQSYSLTMRANVVIDDTKLGDSICVNGTCLTVTRLTDATFTVGLAPETRNKTNLAGLRTGSRVNLERSVTPTTRLGGHFVQGHVDGVGTISQFRPDEDALWVTVQVGPAIMRYIVPKGYVALDGTSLTVVDVGEDWFNVTLIAFTQQHIILPEKGVGDLINVEVDVLGKYVEKIISQRTNQPTSDDLSLDFLAQHLRFAIYE